MPPNRLNDWFILCAITNIRIFFNVRKNRTFQPPRAARENASKMPRNNTFNIYYHPTLLSPATSREAVISNRSPQDVNRLTPGETPPHIDLIVEPALIKYVVIWIFFIILRPKYVFRPAGSKSEPAQT